MRQVLLSNQGGDRATAYAMSNKIVSLPEGYLCTWIDSHRQNQWALVDSNSGQILRGGSLGCPCQDNHCGAAMVVARGAVHAITGGHHSPLQHYMFESATADEWRHIASIDVQGTYPSVVCDSKGYLHLSFRSIGDPWTLDYCRFENDNWTPVQSLIVAEKPGYIYWTNGLAVGLDDCIHLVLGNTRVLSDGGLYYGASHIFSRDTGHTWGTYDGNFLSLPAPVGNVPLMTGDISAERIQSLQEQQQYEEAGPRNLCYQQILLSNPVVDEGGAVHVVVHNGLTGTADILTSRANGFTARPLTNIATGGEQGKRLHMQSSLSLDQTNQLHMALMIEPTDECVWGPPGTYIVRVVAKTDGTETAVEQVVSPDQALAQWLPALEHPNRSHPDHVPSLLYTKGVNAGGFGNNRNVSETEVYLSCP